MIKEAIAKLINKENLTYTEAEQVMNEIMNGETTESQTASFLTALKMKGETTDEITACAAVMREHALRVNHENEVIDIVGTGGDGAQSINISTISAFVAAAAGVSVAKHGNRAASSKCGTADCLEALGARLDVEPEKNEQILKDTGMCFLFAQKYHTAMKYVGPVRKSIGIPTVFNILGPLTNPARVNYQLLGIYSEDLAVPMLTALSNLGVKRAMAVYGTEKLDEISACAPTKVYELRDGEITDYTITPEQFGFERGGADELKGGEPSENAQILRRILGGEKSAARTAVLLNAGAAIHIVKDVPMEDGIRMAREAIDSGAALAKLDEFIAATNS